MLSSELLTGAHLAYLFVRAHHLFCLSVPSPAWLQHPGSGWSWCWVLKAPSSSSVHVPMHMWRAFVLKWGLQWESSGGKSAPAATDSKATSSGGDKSAAPSPLPSFATPMREQGFLLAVFRSIMSQEKLSNFQLCFFYYYFYFIWNPQKLNSMEDTEQKHSEALLTWLCTTAGMCPVVCPGRLYFKSLKVIETLLFIQQALHHLSCSISKLLSRCYYFLQQGGNRAFHVRGRDGWVWVLGTVSEDADLPPPPPLQALSQASVDPGDDCCWLPTASVSWWMRCSGCWYFTAFYWRKELCLYLFWALD